MNTIKPATPLPLVTVDLNGYIASKEWRYSPLTQALTLDEKREVERRCNTLPRLMAEREELVAALREHAHHGTQRGEHAIALLARLKGDKESRIPLIDGPEEV